jgi:hypothetical protein
LRQVEGELEALRRSSAARINGLEGQLRDTATAAAAADTAAAIAAHKIELLERELSNQATIFELKLAAAEDSATKSTRIARLEERIYVAGLQAELNALKNPRNLASGEISRSDRAVSKATMVTLWFEPTTYGCFLSGLPTG